MNQEKELISTQKLPENIEKLLDGSNIDDVELGVRLAYEIMGEKWILENFKFNPKHSSLYRIGVKKYSTRKINTLRPHELRRIPLNEKLEVLLGICAIEAYKR